jgi:hypothetical protein
MTLAARDRRALALLVPVLILGLAYRFWPESDGGKVVAPSADAVSVAEARLARLRANAATVPAKTEILKKANEELALREKGIIRAETGAQAQAQLLQILRRLGSAENLDIRTTELAAIKPLGDDYGQASIAVQMECRMDQLVNLLAALPAQPELLSAGDLRITSANAKDKTVGVRMAVSAVVPRSLVPEKALPEKNKKKGGAL